MCAFLVLVPLLTGLVANARVKDQRIPVTVLTGFLGSGKTTLLNHLLTKQHGKRLAVIENEFGEVGIDDALLGKNAREEAAEPEIIEMMNGCICCTVRGDLVVALKNLYSKISQFDAVIIETTGLADPAPVAQTFFVDDDIQAKFSLDAIITALRLDAPPPVSKWQQRDASMPDDR
mmetsp:Transcript_24458/g.81281  ORF Transcript_24458/g.81281 Transcript_24458/m.81281 type:complete len:176 (-) Transcript_24458:96-623(-)